MFGAVTSPSKTNFHTDQNGCDYSRKALLKKNVTTFQDVEISFFRIKGISMFFIIVYQNLVSNAIMKVLYDAHLCLLIVIVISNASTFETKL